MFWWGIILLLTLISGLFFLWSPLNAYDITSKDFKVQLLLIRSSGAYRASLNGWGKYQWEHTYLSQTLSSLVCPVHIQLFSSPKFGLQRMKWVQDLTLQWGIDHSAANGSAWWVVKQRLDCLLTHTCKVFKDWEGRIDLWTKWVVEEWSTREPHTSLSEQLSLIKSE